MNIFIQYLYIFPEGPYILYIIIQNSNCCETRGFIITILKRRPFLYTHTHKNILNINKYMECMDTKADYIKLRGIRKKKNICGLKAYQANRGQQVSRVGLNSSGHQRSLEFIGVSRALTRGGDQSSPCLAAYSLVTFKVRRSIAGGPLDTKDQIEVKESCD